MSSPRRSIACLIWLVALFAAAAPAVGAETFDAWLGDFRLEALRSGISEATLDSAFADLSPDADVLSKDRSQPGAGGVGDFCGYLDTRLTTTRVERARALLAEHNALLLELEKQYGVPPRYLIALWGLESNFGGYQGNYSVIRSLATLAHDPRRSDVFRKQLLDALRIVEGGNVAARDMKGSWAGAMGQVQFMPSTFNAYAVDHDGDGRKDIWNSVPDALASAANYLEHAGWKPGQAWGRRVKLPSDLTVAGRNSELRPVSEWSQRGVRRYDGGALPHAKIAGRVVLPTLRAEPAFLVYPNYQTILAWNRSTFFGISVGTLADRIADRGDRVCSG